MRLTDNERDLVEDLLSPTTELSRDETSNQKRRHDEIEAELATEDDYATNDTLLRSIFPTFADEEGHGLGIELIDSIKSKRYCGGHSSVLTPLAGHDGEEEQVSSHRGIVVYDYDALSVDDFFDLDQAST